jgi:hypothetical protein
MERRGHPGEGFFPAGGGQLPEGVRNKIVQPEVGEIAVVVVIGLVDEKADGAAVRGEFRRGEKAVPQEIGKLDWSFQVVYSFSGNCGRGIMPGDRAD